MSTKIKVKIKSHNEIALLRKVYLNKSDGWELIRKYQSFFGLGRYVAVMEKEIPNG